MHPSMRLSSMSLVADGPVMGDRSAGIDRGERLRDAGDDLVRADQAQVVVGYAAQRPASLARSAVEDDSAGLGDGERSHGDDAFGAVQCRDVERRAGPVAVAVW